MTIDLPWAVAILAFILFRFVWTYLDHQWIAGRIDDLDTAIDRNRDDATDRMELLEQRINRGDDWIRHLDERTRQQAGALPLDPQPPTQPMSRVLIGHWGADVVDPGVVGPVEAWPRSTGRHRAVEEDVTANDTEDVTHGAA